jgi:cardiolipin synthase
MSGVPAAVAGRTPSRSMLNAANVITLVRFALLPPLAVQLAERDYDAAFVLFVISAMSDVADGLVARRWNLRTRFGAVADPVADKLTMLTATLLLALQGWLPWWFAAAVVLRDVIIVVGVLAYRWTIGPVEMAPSALSKANTGLEFLLLASVMAIGAGHVDDGPWRQTLLLITLATIVLSGSHYVIVWGRKAARSRRAVR